MTDGTGVVEVDIVVGDVVVNVNDTDILVVLSLVSHDNRGLFSFGLKRREERGSLDSQRPRH